MRRNGLYPALLDSIYAMDGINGEFIAELALPLPFAPKNEHEVVIAQFPATIVADYEAAIEWHQDAIEEELEFADGDFISDESARYVAELRADLAILVDRLANM